MGGREVCLPPGQAPPLLIDNDNQINRCQMGMKGLKRGRLDFIFPGECDE